MNEPLIPGTFEVGVTFIKVDKADGRTLYYKVENGAQTEISEQEYKDNQ